MMCKNLSNQRGLTLIEVMVAIVIGVVIVGLVVQKLSRGDEAKFAKAVFDDIAMVNAAAKSWRGTAYNYAGVTMADLTAAEILPAAWGNGAGVNPKGGNYTIAPTGANNSQILVTATGLGNGLCASAQRKFVNVAAAAACAGGTLSVTMD
jgi:prepilin-type N-terminal cleavage/methylation domain-containing protein